MSAEIAGTLCLKAWSDKKASIASVNLCRLVTRLTTDLR